MEISQLGSEKNEKVRGVSWQPLDFVWLCLLLLPWLKISFGGRWTQVSFFSGMVILGHKNSFLYLALKNAWQLESNDDKKAKYVRYVAREHLIYGKAEDSTPVARFHFSHEAATHLLNVSLKLVGCNVWWWSRVAAQMR
jgi:hypothetical protein